MSKTLISLIFFIIFVQNIYCSTLFQFQAWQDEHNITYSSQEDHFHRFQIWKKNYEYIESHNFLYKQGKHTFSLKMNRFGDLTSNEFFHKIMKGKTNYKHMKLNDTPYPYQVKDFPDSWDWRNKGVVPPVPNQGQCGSGSLYAEGDAIESVYSISKGKLIHIDLNEILNCIALGCSAVQPTTMYKYIAKCGIPTPKYPYASGCQYDAKTSTPVINGYKITMHANETDLAVSVYANGPHGVVVDASHSSFQFYSSGIYYESRCSSAQLDHEMLVVGYGVQSSSKYWIVENSWGSSWGMRGYILMSRDRNNNCGIATFASYPTLGTNTFKPDDSCSHWVN